MIATLSPGLKAAALADFVDLACEFMADDARIFEIGLRSVEYMQVRAANAGAAQPDARLARLQRRLRPFDDGEFAWLGAEQRSHCPRPSPGVARLADTAEERARLRQNLSTATRHSHPMFALVYYG